MNIYAIINDVKTTCLPRYVFLVNKKKGVFTSLLQ